MTAFGPPGSMRPTAWRARVPEPYAPIVNALSLLPSGSRKYPA